MQREKFFDGLNSGIKFTDAERNEIVKKLSNIVELKNLERLMSDQKSADMLKLMIRFSPIPRGDGKN